MSSTARLIITALVLSSAAPSYGWGGLAFDAGNETLPAVDSLLDALAELDAEPLISFSYSDLEGNFAFQPERDSWVFTAGHAEASVGEATRVAGVGPSDTSAVFTEISGLAAFALELPITVPCQFVTQTLDGNLVLADIDGDSLVASVYGEWERLGTLSAMFVGQLSHVQVNMNSDGIFEGTDGAGFSMLGLPPAEDMEGTAVALVVPGWFVDENGDMAGFESANVGVIGAIVQSNTPALLLFPPDADKHRQGSGRLDTFGILDCNGNGVPDECEVPPLCSFCPDCDANGVPDECDPDTDGDDVIDACDSCPLDYFDDSDGDGACDSDDECPTDPSKIVAGQCGCGNLEDDDDGDDVANCADQCRGADDEVFAPRCIGAIPTISTWGLLVLTLLLLVVGKIMFGRPAQGGAVAAKK